MLQQANWETAHPLLVVRAVMCLLQLTSTAFTSRNSSLVPVQASLRWVSLLSGQPAVSLADQTAVSKLLTTVREQDVGSQLITQHAAR